MRLREPSRRRVLPVLENRNGIGVFLPFFVPLVKLFYDNICDLRGTERGTGRRTCLEPLPSPNQINEHKLTHLKQLEAESIHIMREVAAEFANPVMLYSIGKDSSVMLHLAMKAFYPAKPPFPLLHVDTTWKFREMIAFRDETAKRLGSQAARPYQRGRRRARASIRSIPARRCTPRS